MQISLETRYCYLLVVSDDDGTQITENIQSTEYPRDENGKVITSVRPKLDIKTGALEEVSNVLYDMIRYREAEFDSSDLIQQLFEKLPKQMAHVLCKELEHDYNIE
jgi:hypothetical protein